MNIYARNHKLQRVQKSARSTASVHQKTTCKTMSFGRFFFRHKKQQKFGKPSSNPKAQNCPTIQKDVGRKRPGKKGEIKSQKEKMENGKMQPSAIRTDG